MSERQEEPFGSTQSCGLWFALLHDDFCGSQEISSAFSGRSSQVLKKLKSVAGEPGRGFDPSTIEKYVAANSLWRGQLSMLKLLADCGADVAKWQTQRT
jgi:hypothetical protein